MRSRTESRVLAERLLRGAALIALVVTLVRLVASGGADAAPLHSRFVDGPSAVVRDSLAALARSGERVTWSGAVTAVAAMAAGTREPRPTVRLAVVADSFAVVADTLGALDSLGTGGGTVAIAAGAEDDEANAIDAFTARERGTRARAVAPAAPEPGRILVLGRAGWEAKFVVAALEEQGWRVDARLRLSDTMQVAQGSAAAPTSGTHAVVVVLDAALGGAAPAIARFVRAGGGLVLAGEGVASNALAAVAPARVDRRLAPESRTFVDVDPLHALPLLALGAPRRDAVVLELRDGARAMAARREGLGRVVQSGYADTWRWRMEGEPGSVAEHRDWWSRLVALALPTPLASASPAPATEGAPRAVADEGAPLAALVHALGPASDAPSVARSEAPRLPAWLGVAILLLLLAEWALRRTRGVA
jgi:hypothetical protein